MHTIVGIIIIILIVVAALAVVAGFAKYKNRQAFENGEQPSGQPTEKAGKHRAG